MDSFKFYSAKEVTTGTVPTVVLNSFTRALTDLCLEHGVVIEDAVLSPMDLAWNGPDAMKWEQYAIVSGDQLQRDFWNQCPTAIER